MDKLKCEQPKFVKNHKTNLYSLWHSKVQKLPKGNQIDTSLTQELILYHRIIWDLNLKIDLMMPQTNLIKITCGYCKGGSIGSGNSAGKKGCSSGLLYLPT